MIEPWAQQGKGYIKYLCIRFMYLYMRECRHKYGFAYVVDHYDVTDGAVEESGASGIDFATIAKCYWTCALNTASGFQLLETFACIGNVNTNPFIMWRSDIWDWSPVIVWRVPDGPKDNRRWWRCILERNRQWSDAGFYCARSLHRCADGIWPY